MGGSIGAALPISTHENPPTAAPASAAEALRKSRLFIEPLPRLPKDDCNSGLILAQLVMCA
jgi:hypothetical protein